MRNDHPRHVQACVACGLLSRVDCSGSEIDETDERLDTRLLEELHALAVRLRVTPDRALEVALAAGLRELAPSPRVPRPRGLRRHSPAPVIPLRAV